MSPLGAADRSQEVRASTSGDLPDAEAAASASSYGVPSAFLWLADLLVLLLSFPLAWSISPVVQRAVYAGQWPMRWLAVFPLRPADEVAQTAFSDATWIPLVMVPATLMALEFLRAHRNLLEQSRTRVTATIFASPLFGLAVVSLVLIAVRNQTVNRSLIFSYGAMSAAILLGYRVALRAYKQRRLLAGQYARNVVLVAPVAARRWLISHFERNVPPTIYRIAGYLRAGDSAAVPPASAQPGDALPDVPCLGEVQDFGQLVVRKPVHELIVVQSPGESERLQALVEQCEHFRVTLRLVPEALVSWEPGDLQLLVSADQMKLPAIVLRPRYLDSDALFVKRVFDIVVSGALLLVISPLLVLIALAIKVTTPRLPVFYPWRVVGYKGRKFTGYKFTTMQADADDRTRDLMHLNEMSGPVFKIAKDPRVTPLGRVLRKFSLNELPQLWSVLKGDMSLVGPRPAFPGEVTRYELWHKRKLCVQPGITCLWQVRGRNRISDFDDWVRMDFEYIDNWSLWLDCSILFRTALAVVRGTGS